MNDLDVEALAAELADFSPREKIDKRSPKEERIIAGFEDIQRFVHNLGRAPQHGEDLDIFERLYAVRLDRLRALPECRVLLEPLDHQGLLNTTPSPADSSAKDIDIEDLAAELADATNEDDITVLRHVRTSADKHVAEELADRKPCEDFEAFKPLFDRVAMELTTGLRQPLLIDAGNRAVEAGDLFVLDGITLYIAEVGQPLKITAGELDRRLRVIYSNGTESNLLLRSLQRAFYNDPGARRLVPLGTHIQGHLGGEFDADDISSGIIYVLRSLADYPYIAQHRDVIHKIGVTRGKVESRIANAEHEATYLLARVEIVRSYKLSGINPVRMEKLLHKIFAAARLQITINDRFGNPVQPDEWFLVPLFVIDETVERVKDGTITSYVYDPHAGELVKVQ
jgi:hypothetical protein